MEKSVRFALLVFIFLAASVSGCAPTPTPVPPTPVPPTSTPLPPTATSIPPTATLPPTATAAPTATTGKIEGRVFQSDTNRAFSGADVSLENAAVDPKDPNWVAAKVTTDADGNYVFENVEPGKYSLSVSVWTKKADDMPCPIMIMQSTSDNQWLMVTVQGQNGKQGFLASQTHIENNGWMPTVFDVAAGSHVHIDADLRCQ